MCTRKTDPETGCPEPLARYALRWALEAVTVHPSALLAVVCIIGCAWLYRDMSALMAAQGELIREQTRAYAELTAELREVNIRLQTLENENRK